MAAPIDYKYLQLTQADERAGRAKMREMHGSSWWRKRGRASWAGFAAEHALHRSINAAGNMRCIMPGWTYDYDLVLGSYDKQIPVEVKTRCVADGWVHPDKFDYITVPMHEGREPVKVLDGMVLFCWYSMSDRRRLWALGYVRGLHEFQRRAVWYEEGAPLPRGGWAGAGGAYVIETMQLRPLPDGLFKEAK